MKTRIKTGKVSLIVLMAVMAVCVAGVAIWCYAVGYQVKEHRQGGSVAWVEYNGSTYYRMDGLTGEYCNFIADHSGQLQAAASAFARLLHAEE